MDIIIASTNEGKIKEIQELISLPHIRWLTYKEFPDWPKIEEKGQSYEENAAHKALTIASRYQKPALADDSGLEVQALKGEPGVKSARYAGKKASDTDNINLLLKKLRGVPPEQRQARFIAVVVLAFPDGRLVKTEGVCPGKISLTPVGEYGFGYDPVFIPEGYQQTLAELGLREKNKLSHRAKALKMLAKTLKKLTPN